MLPSLKRQLKPQEYYYLYSPRRAVPEEMFKYTFQSLVLEGHLSAYYRSIYINRNQKRKRSRLFLTLGKNYSTQNIYTHAESFILSFFIEKEALRPYEIRLKALDKLDDDIRKFMSEWVYKDINELGYCWLKIFLTGEGRRAKKAYAQIIDKLEKEAIALLTDQSALQNYLKELGTGIILVEESALNILDIEVPDLDEVGAVFEVITGGCIYSGGGYYGVGGGYSGGGGYGFGGFGGGAGGGGGSGGSW